MKRQIHLFLTAMMFYTRIPVPLFSHFSDNDLNASTRYFPLIGWIVGLLSFISYLVSRFFFSVEISIIISLIIGVLTTGAFHEDGLADFFDGFGGGWTQEKILEIMKDSRVGTYGMVATLFQLGIKFFALKELSILLQNDWWILMLIFITYHSLARATAIQLSFVLPYVREDEKSKAKPIAKQHTHKETVGVLVFGLIPFLFLILKFPVLMIAFIPLVLLVFYFKYYLKKWINGYTGDCLGAIEQISECIILISFVALWKFI